jgi:hypothetical protein
MLFPKINHKIKILQSLQMCKRVSLQNLNEEQVSLPPRGEILQNAANQFLRRILLLIKLRIDPEENERRQMRLPKILLKITA